MSRRTIMLVALALVAPQAPWAPAVASGEDSAVKPRYLERLDVPSRNDSIVRPGAVVADAHTDEVFVCDTRGQRILIFDGNGVFRFSIAAGDQFRSPLDLAVDPEGFLVVLGNVRGEHGLIHLDFDGLYLGFTVPSPSPDLEKKPRFESLAMGPDGRRLYLTDQENKSLWILERDGTLSSTVDLLPDLEGEERLEQVIGRVDVYGSTVLVAIPTAGQILLFDHEGKREGRVGLKGTAPCQSAFPVAGALDENGDVWMIDKQRIIAMKWRPTDNRCMLEFSGIGRSAGALYLPDDVALDAQGRIYIAQGFEGRVQVFGPAPAAAGPDRAPAGSGQETEPGE